MVSDRPDMASCAGMRRPTLGWSSDMGGRFWGGSASARVPAERCASECGIYARSFPRCSVSMESWRTAYTVNAGACGGERERAVVQTLGLWPVGLESEWLVGARSQRGRDAGHCHPGTRRRVTPRTCDVTCELGSNLDRPRIWTRLPLRARPSLSSPIHHVLFISLDCRRQRGLLPLPRFVLFLVVPTVELTSPATQYAHRRIRPRSGREKYTRASTPHSPIQYVPLVLFHVCHPTRPL